jgi:hypothetical protein
MTIAIGLEFMIKVSRGVKRRNFRKLTLRQQIKEQIIMKIKGAVLRETNKPYSIEELELEPPKEKEALVRYVYIKPKLF